MKSAALAAVLLLTAIPAHAQMSLPGKFEVTDTGSASYTIPISVVPGTAGLEPKLSLQYDSRSGNGLLGVGWSLAGLPAITRCGRTIAQDGQVGGISYDANDRFCLDGQRLVAISGMYGADGTEYRTERESFSRVISYGQAGSGPSHFKVWTKAGLVMEFGNSADSRIEAQGKASVRVWALNKTSDTKSNYFTVSYTEDNANGEYRPDRIDYTGNAAAGTQPQNSVRFVYETRPDIVPLYQAGSLINATQRMAKVQAWQGNGVVREYRLSYQVAPVTQRSRLVSVALCSATTCFPSTEFTWQDGSGAFQSSAIVTATGFTDAAYGAPSQRRYFAMDVNGDGRSDLVMRGYEGTFYTLLSNGSGFSLASSLSTPFSDATYGAQGGERYFIMDVNGDGRSDLVMRAYNGSFFTYLSNGTGFDLSAETHSGFTDAAYPSDPSQRYFIADVNGDGRSDLVMRGYEGTFYTLLSNGSGFSLASSLSTPFSDATYGAQGGERYFIMDVNGDGRSDLVMRAYNGSFFTYLSNGTDFDLSAETHSGFTDAAYPSDPSQRYFIADVNGDGRGDLVARGYDGTLYLYIADGTSVTLLSATPTGYGDNLPAGDLRYFFMDMNGDGNADLVARDNNGWFASYVSTGNAFAYAGSLHTGYSDALAVKDQRYFIADVDGDGRSDIVARDNNGYFAIYLSNGQYLSYSSSLPTGFGDSLPVAGTRFFIIDVNGDGKGDLVVRSTDGTLNTYSAVGLTPDLLESISGQAATAIAFRSLSAPGNLYIKDTGTSACAYPCVDVQGPLYVVSEVRSSNGLGIAGAGGEYRSTYRYAGAKSDQHGRGFLGFRQMTVKDEQTGVEQTTTYRQDYPFTGLVASREKRLGAQLLNRSSNSYDSSNLGGTRRYPFLMQSLEESWELSGAALPAVTTGYQYDSFGNATEVSVSTGDGHAKTTANTYANDTANWLLGRLQRSVVTSTTPGN